MVLNLACGTDRKEKQFKPKCCDNLTSLVSTKCASKSVKDYIEIYGAMREWGEEGV